MDIVTVTLNPALDKTATVDRIRPGELNRLDQPGVDAGGKGINVARMIHALGGRVAATGFLGGTTGARIAAALDELDISHEFVRIQAATRTNLKIVESNGRLTELNEPGPAMTAEEIAILRRRLETRAAGGRVLFVFSGSLPVGVDAGIYRDLVALVRSAGSIAFLDADGSAFRMAIPCGPDLVKPNVFELQQYYDAPERRDIPTLLGLSRRLVAEGVRRVVLSMGGEGALFVDQDEAFHCPALPVEVRSSVGAGDCMVGAIAYADAAGLGWRQAAALAMASSAGAVATPGTTPPPRGVVEEWLARVEFKEL